MRITTKAIESLIKSLTSEEKGFISGSMKKDVKELLIRRSNFLKITKENRTPFYVYDNFLHKKSIADFKKTFKKYVPNLEIYFSMKINHHDHVVNESIKSGLGIEVASIREFKIAKKLGSRKILYYSPGKTNEELKYLLKNTRNFRLNMDSFSELDKLGKLTNNMKTDVQVGIRVNLPIYGDWTKYGIELDKLSDFWKEAKKFKYIHLDGIHFHTSRNKSPDIYLQSIKTLAAYLKSNFNQEMLQGVKFIDFGGGFDTNLKEGFYSWNTQLGKLKSLLGMKSRKKYFLQKSSSLEDYAKSIGNAIDEFLRPIINARYITEPGRILCNEAMHILVQVSDVKDNNRIIVDGGVNLVGWQRFEYEYFPIINLSSPSLVERDCLVYGNLCTTWDLWGYYVYSKKRVKSGDFLLIPYQGALTYTLAQNFISPIAEVYKI